MIRPHHQIEHEVEFEVKFDSTVNDVASFSRPTSLAVAPPLLPLSNICTTFPRSF